MLCGNSCVEHGADYDYAFWVGEVIPVDKEKCWTILLAPFFSVCYTVISTSAGALCGKQRLIPGLLQSRALSSKTKRKSLIVIEVEIRVLADITKVRAAYFCFFGCIIFKPSNHLILSDSSPCLWHLLLGNIYTIFIKFQSRRNERFVYQQLWSIFKQGHYEI